MVVGLGVLAVVSGMLGLGVAFAAVPFRSFFLPNLVHQVQPLTLLLNGLTALFATLGIVQDNDRILSNGVMSTPVLVVNGQILMTGDRGASKIEAALKTAAEPVDLKDKV